MKRFILLLILPGVMLSSLAHAEIVVIVHPQAGINTLDVNQARRLFLGKSREFSNGTPVELIDQKEGSALRNAFYQQVAGKNAAQLRAHWAKRVFSGKGIPPAVVSNDTAVLDWVSKTPGGMGYVDASSVNATVKVVLRVK